MNHLSTTAASSDMVGLWTDRDPILSQVKNYLRSGWPQKNLRKEFKPYSFRVKELSLLEGCILWGATVVVPPQGRKLVLEELHETHTVVSKMKTLTRSCVVARNGC